MRRARVLVLALALLPACGSDDEVGVAGFLYAALVALAWAAVALLAFAVVFTLVLGLFVGILRAVRWTRSGPRGD